MCDADEQARTSGEWQWNFLETYIGALPLTTCISLKKSFVHNPLSNRKPVQVAKQIVTNGHRF